MGGVVSQGICFSPSLFPGLAYGEGVDVTDVLGVIKFDPELRLEKEFENKRPRLNPVLNFVISLFPFLKVFLKNKRKYNTAPWPAFIHKTDETRIQNIPNVLKDYVGLSCYVTEKLDGQSGTFAIYKNKFYVCSRNLHLLKPDNSSYWRIAKEFDIEKKLRGLKRDVCIQGEICGPGIQGNKYLFNKILFFMFSAFDIANQRYLTFEELRLLSEKLGIGTVPVKNTMFLCGDVESLIEMSKRKSVFSCNSTEEILQEGIVVRSMDNKPYGLRGMGEIFSFKVINPEFLLKYEAKENG
jgi:RNA ligase (TIGR02306 family)